MLPSFILLHGNTFWARRKSSPHILYFLCLFQKKIGKSGWYLHKLFERSQCACMASKMKSVHQICQTLHKWLKFISSFIAYILYCVSIIYQLQQLYKNLNQIYVFRWFIIIPHSWTIAIILDVLWWNLVMFVNFGNQHVHIHLVSLPLHLYPISTDSNTTR